MSEPTPQPPEEAVKLPKERQLEAIKQACLRELLCIVTLEGMEDTPFSTRMLVSDRDETGGKRYVTIATPNGVKLPKRSTRIEIRFEYDGLSLVFYTTLQEGTAIGTPGGAEILAWKLKYPGEVLVLQRRAYFRVKASATDPVSLGVSFTGHSEDIVDHKGKQVSSRSPKPIVDRGAEAGEVHGILWDISGGGLSFTLSPEPPFELTPGGEIALSFRLPGIKQQLHLQAQVVSSKLNMDKQRVYSVAYTDVDSTLALRKSHNLVLQFVAQREREIIASLRTSKRWRKVANSGS